MQWAGIDGEETNRTSDVREGYSGGQAVEPEEASATWPGATSVKMENIFKKLLETVSLFQST